MKKLVTIVASLVLAGGMIFAGDFYNGDIQLQLGAGFDSVKLADVDDKISAKVFDFGLETWHLFKPMDMLGVGFMTGFYGGLGSTDKWSYELVGEKIEGNENGFSGNFNWNIGPAVGLYLGNVVRLGATIGLDVGCNLDTPFVYEFSSGYGTFSASVQVSSAFAGIDFGLQAKFFPNSVVNPVIGWRLVKGFSSTYDVYVSGLGSDTETVSNDYTFTQNVIYAALSFSW